MCNINISFEILFLNCIYMLLLFLTELLKRKCYVCVIYSQLTH